jgi:hypothetical protein
MRRLSAFLNGIQSALLFLRASFTPRDSVAIKARMTLKEMNMQTRVERGTAEDRFTGAIEAQTSKIPSSGYLVAAIGSMAVSAYLKAQGNNDWSLFVGQWAPSFLLLGIYNKLVKQHGSDAYSKAA